MKPNKSVCALSWGRMLKEPLIWILLLVCIYSVFAYYFDFLKLHSPFSIETAKKISEIMLGLSYSYIAGMVFYFLSEFRTTTHKSRPVLTNAVEDLRLFKVDRFDN